jgi:hypothetical protein
MRIILMNQSPHQYQRILHTNLINKNLLNLLILPLSHIICQQIIKKPIKTPTNLVVCQDHP